MDDIRTLAKYLAVTVTLSGALSFILIYMWGALEYEDWLWMIHKD
jgi:hypothetical protein